VIFTEGVPNPSGQTDDGEYPSSYRSKKLENTTDGRYPQTAMPTTPFVFTASLTRSPMHEPTIGITTGQNC